MVEFVHSFMTMVPGEMVILTEIGIMIIIAAIFAFLVRLFRQPLIPAYIITGILIGPLILGLVSDMELVQALSNIGVAFLIFTAGLEIKFRKLKEVGSVASIGGLLQVFILFALGFLITGLFSFTSEYPKAVIYVGLVVAFSSTMVVVKILSDKRQINSLHGRIIIGILLLQDLVAIIAITILSSDLSLEGIFVMLTKASIFILAAYILSGAVNPVLKKSAENPELFLLVSISLLFLFSIGSSVLLNSLIIGAFFAGVALANSDYKTEIQGKITSLRDFFAVIFFVTLGMQLNPISGEFVVLLILLFVLVIAIKPIITMLLVRAFGYKKRTSFLTGNSLAQTSEFSLIIVTLGLRLGHIGEGLFSTLVLLTILTMSLTTYLMNYERKLQKWLDWPLDLLKRVHTKKEELEYFDNDGNRIIIFGCHRMGSLFLKELEKEKKKVLVVDYNPEIIKSLIEKKIPCIYGDFINDEVFEKSDVKNAEMIISTIPEFEDNIYLVRKARKHNPQVTIFIVADRISEALQLYDAGADYVFLPPVIGAEKGVEILRKAKRSKPELKELKKEHIKYLNSIHHILY